MAHSRRDFLKLLTAAGVSASTATWLVERAEALEGAGLPTKAPGPGVETWVPTTCGFCRAGCGLKVRLIDGLPVGSRGNPTHIVNHGKVCPAAHATIQMLYSVDRVRTPLLRSGRRTHPGWNEATWEDVLKTIADRVGGILKKKTPQRIAFLDGRAPGLGTRVAQAFIRGSGSRNYVPIVDPQQDTITREAFGWPRAGGVDLERALTIALFDFDAFGSDGSPVWQSRVYAHGRGRTINRPIYVSIGPRLLGSAAKCDHWLPARPGTEGIVALAMANRILSEGLEDRDYLAANTDWNAPESAAMRTLIEEISPAVASDLTGVPAVQIERIAELFASHRPAVALTPPGLPARPTATMTHVAVNALNLVVGAVAVLDAQIVILQIDVEIGKDQLFLDEVPDDAGRLVAVELDDWVFDLDLVHALSPDMWAWQAFGRARRPRGLTAGRAEPTRLVTGRQGRRDATYARVCK